MVGFGDLLGNSNQAEDIVLGVYVLIVSVLGVSVHVVTEGWASGSERSPKSFGGREGSGSSVGATRALSGVLSEEALVVGCLGGACAVEVSSCGQEDHSSDC